MEKRKEPVKIITKFEPIPTFEEEFLDFVKEVLNYEENNEKTKTTEN